MNTKVPLFIILSLGVATAMVSMSGVAGLWSTAGPADDLQSGDQLRSQADSHELQAQEDGTGGYDGQVSGDADSDIVGVILGTMPKMIGLLAVPGMLSGEMMAMGIYNWAAIPLGLLANLVTYVGGFQLVTGRIYQ